MPLPVLHSFAGYAIYRAAKTPEEENGWKLALYCIALANLADFDFIPGILLNDPNLCHRGISHSLGAAFVFSFLAAAYTRWRRKKEVFKVFWISLAAYYSHVVLDFFGGTNRPIPLFWPFHRTLYHWPIWRLTGIPIHSGNGGTSGFLAAFLTPSVIEPLLIEASIVLLSCSFFNFVNPRAEIQPEPAQALIRFAFSFLLFMTAVAVKAVAG